MSTYLITGATGGIGAAICRRLSKQHKLVLVARNAEKLNALASSLPGQHIVLPTDMASDASVADLQKSMEDSNIIIDGLVLMPPQPHAAADPMPASSVWRELFQSSFIGPLSLLRVGVERMRPEPSNGKRSKIVIISGISSAQVLSHYATANVIRTAWVGEAKTLAFALGPQGIHVNTLSLGGTLSPWYREKIEQKAEKAGLTFESQMVLETDNVPLRKYGEPSEVAGAVEALLADFSDHITGVNIMHDGGFTRAY